LSLAKIVTLLHGVLTFTQALYRSNENRNESGVEREQNALDPLNGPDTSVKSVDGAGAMPGATGGFPSPPCTQSTQLPLIHVVDNDDAILANTPKATWFPQLRDMHWQGFRELGANYYNELHQFNVLAAVERRKRERCNQPANPEKKNEAKERLLFERPTMRKDDAPHLHEAPEPNAPFRVDPEQIAPGVIPFRVAGRAPKDFFSLLKAFLGVVFMGFDPEPENVHHHLTNNPAFARACGFTPPDPKGVYRQTDVPSERKLQQFDQIMTRAGLWNQMKLDEVKRAIQSGAIRPEEILVHDTTHYHAYSSFEVVEYKDEKGKTQKKSAPKVTKRCGCEDKQHCPHEWAYTDDGAGTVVKSNGKMYWAHKASVLSLAKQGVVIDAYAVADAATHDSKTLVESIERLYQTQPYTRDWFNTVLDDGAADDDELKKTLLEKHGLRLVCSQNPRRRKPITKDLPRGVEKITPCGEPICLAGHSFDFKGVRWDTDMFIFGPPLCDDGQTRCPACQHKPGCCPTSTTGRHLTLPFSLLPFIDPEDPPLAKRFKAMLAKRTTIERLIKTLKCDLGTDKLNKRGNNSFQARLDKTLVAYFILLRDGH